MRLPLSGVLAGAGNDDGRAVASGGYLRQALRERGVRLPDVQSVQVERRRPRGGLERLISSKILGGASQTVSKIRVECNGT